MIKSRIGSRIITAALVSTGLVALQVPVAGAGPEAPVSAGQAAGAAVGERAGRDARTDGQGKAWPGIREGSRTNLIAAVVERNPDPKLVSASTAFGLNLLREITKKQSDKNALVSPVSVALALDMTLNGAGGKTRVDMQKALGLTGQSLDALNESNAALLALLRSQDPKVELSIANALWAKKSVQFKPDFLKRDQQSYEAKVESVDFADPGTLPRINGWVNKETRGKISSILDRIDRNAILILMNAVYFKGTWTDPFRKARTQEGDFSLLSGQKRKLPMMSKAGNFQYLRSGGFQAVSLPYGSQQVSMYIFLPDTTTGLSKLLRDLTPENWSAWMTKFSDAKGRLVLPRFKLQYDADLSEPLKAMGMRIAFEARAADFHNMCKVPPPVYIAQVKHKTRMDVDEQGTEAAAVTAVTAVAMAARVVAGPPPFEMVVDHPFVVAIRDNKTGALLFLASVAEPG